MSEQGTMSSVTEKDEVKTCPTKKMTWRIENYSKVKQNNLFSTPVMFEGFNWQMSLYPNKEADGYLSLYLGVVEPTSPAVGWFVKANYVFKFIDQLHPNEFVTKDSGNDTFNSTYSSWGHKSFISKDLLENQEKGYVLNDTCVVEMELTVTAASEICRINHQLAQEDFAENVEVKTCPTKKMTWRIKNYSKVKQNKLYSTPVLFEGYQWQMYLYPDQADGYLSLYLGVVEPTSPAVGWFVKANYVFKFIDQLHPNEFVTKDSGNDTFNSTNTSWGHKSFFSKDLLENQEKGYVLNDMCVIEMELTVTAASEISHINHQLAEEDFMENVEVKTCPTKKITWRIENYSKVKQNKLFSTPVLFEGYKWQMSSYPNKNAAGHLSLFLGVVEPAAPAVGWFVKANFVFKFIDQLHPNEFFAKDSGNYTYKSTSLSWGFKSFMSIDSLENQQKGYILNDTCVIELELTVTAASAAPEVISRIKNQQPAQEDYLLHLETMDSIHAKARSFLKSPSADDDHVDKSAVKLLKDAVKAEEEIIAKISKLRNRHAEELEAAAKEAKELIDQSLDSTIDGILDARCKLRLASLCADLDECANIQKAATKKDAGGIEKKLDALRKRRKDESEVARKQVEALFGQRVEVSKRTQQLYVTITNEKVVERSKSKSTWWRNLISSFKR